MPGRVRFLALERGLTSQQDRQVFQALRRPGLLREGAAGPQAVLMEREAGKRAISILGAVSPPPTNPAPPERAPQTISHTLRHRWAERNAGPAEAASLWAVGSGTVQAAGGVRGAARGTWPKVLLDSPGPPSVAKGRFPGVRTAEESRRSGSARV